MSVSLKSEWFFEFEYVPSLPQHESFLFKVFPVWDSMLKCYGIFKTNASRVRSDTYIHTMGARTHTFHRSLSYLEDHRMWIYEVERRIFSVLWYS
jgi:hypothetical protein